MNISRMLILATVIVLVAAAMISCTKRTKLKVDVYNPGAEGIFQVNSVIVYGKNDAVLIDTQFSTFDAIALVDMIKKSGRNLKVIYISHGDPDFYFGLETILNAYPQAEVFATQHTIDRIEKTMDNKMRVWGPLLGAGAPERVIVPKLLNGASIMLEGEKLEIVGLDSRMPERTFVWISSIRTVAGGVLLDAGEHMFMADTQPGQERRDWLLNIELIKSLNPKTVIPGHSAPGTKFTVDDTVGFTTGYIKAFEEESIKAANSTELINAMRTRYPNLTTGEKSLEISAQVATGEITWE